MFGIKLQMQFLHKGKLSFIKSKKNNDVCIKKNEKFEI